MMVISSRSAASFTAAAIIGDAATCNICAWRGREPSFEEEHSIGLSWFLTRRLLDDVLYEFFSKSSPNYPSLNADADGFRFPANAQFQV
jgi:hypothetical protein